MATSPLRDAARPHPFSDLLFSPRAAFVWNETLRSVAWMNAAARTKFGLSPQDLRKSLPIRLTRQFAACFDRAEGSGGPRSIVTFKIARRPVLEFSLEILKLAGGHDGLIVAELQAVQGGYEEPRVAKPAGKGAQGSKNTIRRAPAGIRERPANNVQPAPVLTPDELRAFRAIGRKVRGLCLERQRAGTAFPPRGQKFMLSGEPAAQMLQDVLSAFDLVLFLNDGFSILRMEGRAHRLGWRKSRLLGKHATELLVSSEQAIFDRMAGKSAGQAQISRETLLLRGELGESAFCGAILGRWPNEDAAFFLALLSLKIPQRLKKLQSHGFSSPDMHRLAA